MAKIMVVEDEPITAADLEQKLAALGHEVAWLDTGEEAVAQAGKVAPDLVLMDIRLRGTMTGIDAAQQLRARSEIPVVFLTAFADKETVDRACETQPYGYLLKPFTERSVATAVQVALARANAEQAHIERERWVSAALRGAGEALVAVDSSFAIRFLNEHAEALLNVKERDVIGQDARQVVRFVEGSRDESNHPLNAALSEARVTSSARRALLSSSGTRLDVSLSAAPVFSASGEKTGAVLVFRQVSSREREDALGGTPLEAFNTLTMQLSHEINNPLTYNLGALHLALRELDQLRALSALGGVTSDAATARETQLLRVERLLRHAHEGATRVADVMRELGSYSPSERVLAPLHPVELLDLAIGLSGVEDAAHLRLVRTVQAAPMVRANKWQLARLLAHGLQSTVDALLPRAPGELTLDLWVGTDARGWAEIRAEAHHTQGLAAPFKHEAKGEPSSERLRQSSLAMTVAEHVIEGLGGELILRKQSDGRKLTLRLPPMSVAEAQVEAEVLHGDKTASRGSVLIVDDEPMIGRVLEITLQPEHDVTAVCSAEDALALLERGNAFDVILCDLTMPGMNGQQFYERLHHTRPEVASRVIMMSGGALTEQGERFLKRMEGRRIDKPFRTDQLLPLLSQHVRARRSNAQA